MYIVYTKDDKYWDELGAKEFTAFISKGRKHLRVYGNFAARYIVDNPRVLLKENIEDCDWKEAGEIVLKEFYKAAGLRIPEWVNLLVDETNVTEAAIQEANQMSYFGLRGFFVQAINNAYRTDPILDAKSLGIEVSFVEKLSRCLKQQLVPYLHDHKDRSRISKVVLTHDIIGELKRHKISNITTMQALAREIPEFEYGDIHMNGKTMKTVHGPYSEFVKFLNSQFQDEEGLF